MIKLAIIDDDLRFAKALKNEMDQFGEIEWSITKDSGLQFSKDMELMTISARPNVILMDISMGQPDEGIQATRKINEKFPDVKVIMFTNAEDDERVFEAFKSGAVGYLLKNEKPVFIYKTILDAFNGGAQMSPSIALKTIQFLHQIPESKPKVKTQNDSELSDRELDVLRLIARGLTYQTISDQLFISVETVKKHMNNIYRKLHVSNKIEALNRTREYL